MLRDLGALEVSSASHGLTAGKDFYILINVDESINDLMNYSRQDCIHIPRSFAVGPPLHIVSIKPQSLWDVGDRSFLLPSFGGRSPVVYVLEILAEKQSFFILCRYGVLFREPFCTVFPIGELPQVERAIRRKGIHHDALDWDDLEAEAPEVAKLNNRWTYAAGGLQRTLVASFATQSTLKFTHLSTRFTLKLQFNTSC